MGSVCAQPTVGVSDPRVFEDFKGQVTPHRDRAGVTIRKCRNMTFLEELRRRPCYVFTSDLDWAPENMVRFCIEAHRDVPLTPFVTDRSQVITERYQGERKRLVGVHPNFRAGSTHGNSPAEVVDFVRRLWPESRFYRCHCFYEDSNVSRLLYESGFEYNSNLALHLQERIMPLHHQSGALCLPVFLEDDCLLRNGPVAPEELIPLLGSPGLKIFNFHPIHICLNTPDLSYYDSVKPLVGGDSWKEHQHDGKGIRTILDMIIKCARTHPGLGVFYLDDVYELLLGKTQDAYAGLTSEERVRHVTGIYDSRDATQAYATSRDFNMRELEVDFIASNLASGMKVLDLGCGNGYTDIKVAKVLDCDIVGLDISHRMIEGAQRLVEQFKPLLGRTEFIVCDSRKIPYDAESFDAVITERYLLNLPDRQTQTRAIQEIYRVLKKGGTCIMVEGSADGLEKLNKLRVAVGLQPIPDRSEDNVSSLKFSEEEVEAELCRSFRIKEKRHWGTYFLISRVVHPLLVAPQEPKWSADINKVARQIAEQDPDHAGLGHKVGYVLCKDRDS